MNSYLVVQLFWILLIFRDSHPALDWELRQCREA